MVRWSVSSIWVLILVALIQLASTAKDSTEYVLAPVIFVTDRVPFKVNGETEKFRDLGQALANTSACVRYVLVPKRPDILETWSCLESLGLIDQSQVVQIDTNHVSLIFREWIMYRPTSTVKISSPNQEECQRV